MRERDIMFPSLTGRAVSTFGPVGRSAQSYRKLRFGALAILLAEAIKFPSFHPRKLIPNATYRVNTMPAWRTCVLI
jgi:hypothetical protein